MAVFEKVVCKDRVVVDTLKIKEKIILKDNITVEGAITNAIKDSKTYTNQQINLLKDGVSESFDTLAEIQEQIKSVNGGTLFDIIESNKSDLEASKQDILDGIILQDCVIRDLDIKGDLRIEGNVLETNGHTEIDGRLEVNEETTLNSTLDVSGATTLTSTLDVTGATTLSSTLDVTDATTVGGTLEVNGDTTFNSDLTISGDLHIVNGDCLLYTSPSPRDRQKSRMPSSA